MAKDLSHDRIARVARHAVFSGQFAAGEALREQSLAEHFGISRGPIRDALLQLTQEGLLIAEQHRGVRVRHPDVGIRPLVVELRRQVEGFALERLCENGGDLDFMELNLERFSAACKSGDMVEVVEYDMAFHRYIVELGGRDLVAIWVPALTHMMLPYSRHKDLMESYEEHRAIVVALRAGDAKTALERLWTNIQ